MASEQQGWGLFVELRPDQLQQIVDKSPVVYWPLGLIEHHGWHLPVGFDGVKADRLCRRFAERTGGVVMPVMWWGGGGGHGAFKWTLYQPLEAARAIFERSVTKLTEFGFRAIVMVAGHYPWVGIMDEVLPAIAEAHPDVLLLHGTEGTMGMPEVKLEGDHAARWETAYGLALLPDLVDLDALNVAHDEADAWPSVGPPPAAERYPGVQFDVANPLFAQLGEDARRADAAEAEAGLSRLVEYVAARVAAGMKDEG